MQSAVAPEAPNAVALEVQNAAAAVASVASVVVVSVAQAVHVVQEQDFAGSYCALAPGSVQPLFEVWALG